MLTGSSRWVGTALAAVLIAFLTACAPEAPKEPVPPKLMIKPARFRILEGWRADTQAETLDAFARSCAKLTVQPKDRALGVAGTVADWWRPAPPCPRSRAATMPPPAPSSRRGSSPTLLPTMTSPKACSPAITRPSCAVVRPGGRYSVPLYRKPDDLVMVDLGEFRDAMKGERIAGRVVDGRLRP